MTPLHPHRRAITIAAVALAVTAIAAPAASARFDLGTQQQSSGPHTQTVPVAPPTLAPANAALAAAIERAKLQALVNHVPPMGRTSNADTNAYATVTHPNPATPSGSGGFDWSVAAIGAAIAAVIVLLITASTLAARQRRQPRHP